MFVPQRLHSSPSLPNLWLPARHRPPPASPDASPPATALRPRFPSTALHSKFGPLDLAAPLALDALDALASPRRPPLPLTPPLTPSSSLNDAVSVLGQPVTPTDAFTENRARWRAPYHPVKQPRPDHGQNVISLDDDDDDVDAPTESPAGPAHEALPSRFLLVSNVPRHLSQAAVRAIFNNPGDSDAAALKGIWAGHLAAIGIVILVFYDIRACEHARRRLSGRRVRASNDRAGDDREVELRAAFLSLDEAKRLTPRNPSPVTEIEAETAFFLQLLAPQTADLAVVQDILASFGKLLAFRERDGRGECFYVEYYDVRETSAAFHGLQNTPSVLEHQMRLYPAHPQMQMQYPPAGASHRSGYPAQGGYQSAGQSSYHTQGTGYGNQIYATNAGHDGPRYTDGDSAANAIPFPRSADHEHEQAADAHARPRSVSAGAGDGVTAFALRMRLSLADMQEQQRRHSLADERRRHSRDLERRHSQDVDRQHPPQDPQDARQRSVSFGAGGQERSADESYHAQAGAEEARGATPGCEYAYYGAGGYEYEYAHPQAPCFIPAAPPHRVAPRAQYTLPQARRPARARAAHAKSPAVPAAADGDPAFVVQPRRCERTRLHAPAADTVGAGGGGGQPNGVGNQINVDKIEAGTDTRTTVMIKNIPNKMSDRDLLAFLDAVCPRRFDFFYLRMDFQNGCNVGYAFVNFISVDDLLAFARARLGTKWNMYSSEKVLQMSYANYQGKEALVEKFKNSGIMDERTAWRPKIFFSDGPEQGLPEQFPPPTHQRRKERSAHNRGALFVPGAPRA